MKVSISEIRTFKNCPRQWWLQYVQGWELKIKPVASPLNLGGNIHKALEEATLENDLSVEKLQSVFADQYPDMRDLSLEDARAVDEEKTLGFIMLVGYVQWIEEEGIFADHQVMATELSLSMKLGAYKDEDVLLVGKLDQVFRKTDGMVYFLDYKTTASFDNLERELANNEQVLTYQTLMLDKAREHGFILNGAEFIYLKKNKRGPRSKPPYYRLETVNHNTSEILAYKKRMNWTVRRMAEYRLGIDNECLNPSQVWTNPTRDCSWRCSFYTICPMMNDPKSSAGEYMETFYDRKGALTDRRYDEERI